MSARSRPGLFESLGNLPGGCPLTWLVIGANVLTFLVAFVAGPGVWRPLIFRTGALLEAPWSLLTYPLVGAGGIFWLLIGGYMMWLFGGSLERSWGARDYSLFLALVSAATGLGLWLGASLLGSGAVLAGLGMPLSAAVVAWATINPAERLLLYFVIPLQARWLAILAVVFVFFTFPFPLGVFALAGPGAAWWYVRRGRLSVPAWRIPARRGLALSPLAMYRRWRMKRRFMRLMRGVRVRDDRERGPH